MQLILIEALSVAAVAQTTPLAKPGCQVRYGHVGIPYPYGMTKATSMMNNSL